MNALLEIVGRFGMGKDIVVFGDPMIDVYHFGSATRLSPEAPVPVFVEGTVERRWGGAANVLQNIKALGFKDTLQLFPEDHWIEKHRYMVGTQQLFRVDKEYDYGRLWRSLESRKRGTVVISDYAKGWCDAERCRAMINSADITVVDPKGTDWTKYANATVVCPNAEELRGNWDSPNGYIFHKCGARGIEVIYSDRSVKFFPARKRHVYDVTGAGDVVTAVVAAVLTVGGSIDQAATLANIAAGWSVSQVGTVACTAEKLKELVCERELDL